MKTIHYTATVRSPKAADNVVDLRQYHARSHTRSCSAASLPVPPKSSQKNPRLLRRTRTLSSLLELSLCATLLALSFVLLVKCLSL